MSGELRQKHMIPLHMEVKATELADPAEWSSHEGEEFIYILSGSIELHTEFYEPLRLDSGDSAYFDSQMRHTFVNLGTRGRRDALNLLHPWALFPQSREGTWRGCGAW